MRLEIYIFSFILAVFLLCCRAVKFRSVGFGFRLCRSYHAVFMVRRSVDGVELERFGC